MPKAFDNCVKQGGRVRTKKPTPSTYMPICYSGSKSYAGHVKHTKSKPAHKTKRK